MDTEFFLRQVLERDNGYRHARDLGDGRFACISIFTGYLSAILVGQIGDTAGYSQRWDYSGYDLARDALNAWDGQGEPQGWHRDAVTGRRRNSMGNDFIHPAEALEQILHVMSNTQEPDMEVVRLACLGLGRRADEEVASWRRAGPLLPPGHIAFQQETARPAEGGNQ